MDSEILFDLTLVFVLFTAALKPRLFRRTLLRYVRLEPSVGLSVSP